MQSREPLPSNFESLIDELFSRDERRSGIPRAGAVSFNSLQATWQLPSSARGASAEINARRHPYAQDGDEPDVPNQEMLLDPNRILIELGLASNLTEDDIIVLRREFALRNHPDRVQSELRTLATQRMMIANDLMDRYVARLRRSAG